MESKLLTRDTLLRQLNENIKASARIDIAVAWASTCDATDALIEFSRRERRLRAVVGIYGNSTHPETLRQLLQFGQLRLANQTERIFHPKLYLFHLRSGVIGWIGSANLTRGGFQQNDELVMEFRDDGSAQAWFDNEWARLQADCSARVEDYAENWKPPQPPPRDPSQSNAEPAYESIEQPFTWKSFVDSIHQANGAFARPDNASPVTGEFDSWLNTATVGHQLVRREDWSNLTHEEFYVFVGRHTYGHLGSMRGAGEVNNIFRENTQGNLVTRQKIRSLLTPIFTAPERELPHLAGEFIAEVSSWERFGGAVATRFLCLARPDLAISVNQGSRTRLAERTGLPPSTLSHAPHGRARSYLDLLEWFADQEWYARPTPQNPYEELLAAHRAALFDALVYAPPENH